MRRVSRLASLIRIAHSHTRPAIPAECLDWLCVPLASSSLVSVEPAGFPALALGSAELRHGHLSHQSMYIRHNRFLIDIPFQTVESDCSVRAEVKGTPFVEEKNVGRTKVAHKN
jgi:hypothetical protein